MNPESVMEASRSAGALVGKVSGGVKKLADSVGKVSDGVGKV